MHHTGCSLVYTLTKGCRPIALCGLGAWLTMAVMGCLSDQSPEPLCCVCWVPGQLGLTLPLHLLHLDLQLKPIELH